MIRRTLLYLVAVLLPLAALATGALRPLSTDRPGQTENPFTIDAGHVQLEFAVAVLTQDSTRVVGADLSTRVVSWAPLSLRYGVSPRTELQLMLDPYVRVTEENRSTGRTTHASGGGDLTTRLKLNFWGNDGGPTALGLIPWIKWPLPANAARNGKTEFGIILPFSMELGAGWGLGAHMELACVRDERLERLTRFRTSYGFSHDLGNAWSGYFELAGETDDGSGSEWAVQFECGLTHMIGENLQIDGGLNFGLTDAAPDFQPFFGVSRRF